MKRVYLSVIGFMSWALFFLLSASLVGEASEPRKEEEEDLKKLVSHLHWLGHDTFRIDGDGIVIYLDPFMLKDGLPKADLILITHDHRDHNSPDDVAKIMKADTTVVTVAKGAEKFKGDVRIVKPGDEMTVRGVFIKAIPAYNINKFRSPGVPFHPKDAGYVGFIITVKGITIYHAGDSDLIPEMKGLRPDVALLPVSGIYVMTAEEAVDAAAAVAPKLAIPMHVGGPVGQITAADKFKAEAKVPVIILPLEK